MIFLFFGNVFSKYFQMYLNTLLQYLCFVFTSIAGKYFVFVFNYFLAAVFLYLYLNTFVEYFCPSLLNLLLLIALGHKKSDYIHHYSLYVLYIEKELVLDLIRIGMSEDEVVLEKPG